MNNLVIERAIAGLQQLRHSKPLAAPTSVTIIGAGITGLCCAYELQKLGVLVTLLEADPQHIGGRIRTLRESDTLYAELGAMRIPKGHHLTRYYLETLGLKLRPFVQESDKVFALARGQKVARNAAGYEALKAKYALTESERLMSVDDMWHLAVVSVLDGLTLDEKQALYSKRFTSPKLIELDRMSLKDAFIAAGLSAEAREYVTVIYGVSTLMQTALTEHLREELEGVWFNGFDEVVGGTDLLPQRMFAAMQGKIKYYQGAKVVGIHNQSDRVDVCYQLRDGTKSIMSSDFAICTLPFGVLGKIDFANSISHVKQRAFSQVNYDSATKVLIRTKNRFWELNEKIYGGGNIYDAGLGHTWYPADNASAKDPRISNAPSYLLASYTWGQHARRIDTMNNLELKEFIFLELKKVHPYLELTDILSVMRWSWGNHTHSAGAYAFFNPSDQHDYFAAMQEPEGRLCFAGEHCSLYHSWIQGALLSAWNTIQYLKNQFK
ncbi:flavin monoamine oxidase family protein [Pseudoalteromonas fenneropenaei]|uniref:Tryptophan 2-monooxygenase n=1 Tax=Pseudoalteromonas fenneropenaei TaxID=1737459 RepID=A0ABV7CJ33_9GAMM